MRAIGPNSSAADVDAGTIEEQIEMKAFAYVRTSSGANVGADKDSDKRQLQAIQTYAEANAIEIAGIFYDAAVSGADPVLERPGFMDMLAEIAGNGVKTILVETANRFARDLMVQEAGFKYLQDQGITLIAVDSPAAFVDDSPTAVLIRQILGAVAQFDKAMTVAKLRGARERKKHLTGRCEGRKPAPDAVKALAGELYSQGLSLCGVAAGLARRGFVSPSGKPYSHSSIVCMLGRAAIRTCYIPKRFVNRI